MGERRQEITDDGALHKYRTEIPNTIIRGMLGRGLSLPARWLYVYFKSIAGDSGECWQNMTTIAVGSQLSRGVISKARRELADAKLIAIVKGKGAYHETDHIRVLDIWRQNMTEFCGIPSSPHERDTSSPHEREREEGDKESTPSLDDRVHHMNAASSPHEQPSSPHEQPSSPHEQPSSPHEQPSSPHERLLKKIPEKKIPEDPLVSSNEETFPKEEKLVAKKKPQLHYMPEEEEAQEAIAASVLDDNFEKWRLRRYPSVDIHEQWDCFVNYCRSSGRGYADFRAAFMNSFRWENSPAQHSTAHATAHVPTRSFAEQRRQREAEAARQFLGGTHAGPARSTGLSHGDDAPIDNVEYRRVDD
jgi:hypothetical protein